MERLRTTIFLNQGFKFMAWMDHRPASETWALMIRRGSLFIIARQGLNSHGRTKAIIISEPESPGASISIMWGRGPNEVVLDCRHLLIIHQNYCVWNLCDVTWMVVMNAIWRDGRTTQRVEPYHMSSRVGCLVTCTPPYYDLHIM
jgi:hypothetical protein